jgi:hypothetical protein
MHFVLIVRLRFQGVPIGAARSHHRQARADAVFHVFPACSEGAGEHPKLGVVFTKVFVGLVRSWAESSLLG